MDKETYEERVYEMTKQFTTNDIQVLIDEHIDAAGLILMPAFAGMIALGRALYGFDVATREVFLKFAQYRMKLRKSLAAILFDNVRSGLLYQWCAEVRVVLVAWDGRPFKPRLYWPTNGSETSLTINAAEVGRLYISAVQQLPEYCDTQKHQQVGEEQQTEALRNQIASFRATL